MGPEGELEGGTDFQIGYRCDENGNYEIPKDGQGNLDYERCLPRGNELAFTLC